MFSVFAILFILYTKRIKMECDAKNLVKQFVTNIPLQNISVS